MELGWCDVCLRVASASASRAFYSDLGFYRVEGSDDEGWAVVTNGTLRLGLFEPTFMSGPISLNFRGGDVLAVAERFGLTAKVGASGGASASMRDPDGYAIFFDCAPGEERKDEALPG